MHPEAKGKFFKLLGEVMTGYGKELDPKTMEVWFAMLAPFEPATIRRAFDAYAAERPDFAPAPNGIAARCKLLDGRPDENEAWAVAITSQDEAETVVWTGEMAAAFNLARPLLVAGDEIGARMAFKDTYKRLVGEARALNKPVDWSVSAGWDASRRQVAVQKAVVAGLLEGPQERLAIANGSTLQPARPEGLERVLEALRCLENPIDKAERVREQQIVADAEADRKRREEIDRQTKDYLRRHPEARYGHLSAEGKP